MKFIPLIIFVAFFGSLFFQEFEITLISSICIILYLFYRWITKPKELGAGERGPVRQVIKNKVLQIQRGHCKRCSQRKYLKFHHIVPRAMRGDNRVSNIVALCSFHHDQAHDPGTGKATYNTVPKYLRR